MSYIEVGQENSRKIELHYNDHGSGDTVVLIHGWPLSGASWEKQVWALVKAGYRVITYDRRGFGESTKPADGYDYDTLTDDLEAILTKLDLTNVTLVGFSMGGGEVARYLGKYGTERVKKAAFISAITPALLKTSDNPEGIDEKIFDQIQEGLAKDRPAFLTKFFYDFFNVGILNQRISEDAVKLHWTIAALSSPIAMYQTVTAWKEDFRNDLESVSIPVLVVHGNSDKTVPLPNSGKRMKDLTKNCKYVELDGAPHGLNWTHWEELNEHLISFLGGSQR